MTRVMKTNKEKYEIAKKLVADGKSVTEATKTAQMHIASYYDHKRRDPKPAGKATRPYKKKKAVFEAVPIEMDTNDFVFKGSPRSVARFIKELSNQFGVN